MEVIPSMKTLDG
jgi:hypothetical protein